MSAQTERIVRAGQLSVEDIGKSVRVKVAEKTWVTGPLVNIHNAVVDKKTVVSVQINGVESVGNWNTRAFSYSAQPNFFLSLKDEVTIYE